MKPQPEKGEWFIFTAKNGTPCIGCVTGIHSKTDKRYVSFLVHRGVYVAGNPVKGNLHKYREVDVIPNDVAHNLIALYKE